MDRRESAASLSPYRGLEPFDERDAPFFFGRDRETRLIAASLFAAPLTLLYGASGVGKSSVLRAGLLPRLRESAELLPVVFPNVESNGGGAATVVQGWQSDPLTAIKETVARDLFASAGDDRERRARYEDVVAQKRNQPLAEFLAACSEASARRLMLILDQFEEYSLYHPDDDAFARQFPAAIVPGNLTVSFLVSLREDAVAKLDRFKGRIPTLWDSYRRIDHLSRRAAEDAIRLPLDEYNRRRPEEPPIGIEAPLVDAVLDAVRVGVEEFVEAGGGGVPTAASSQSNIETPYLQLVMMRLWEAEREATSSMLRLATLQRLEGASAILRTHLDGVMQQFNRDEQDLAAKVFHRLVTPSGTKVAFTARDLAEYEQVEPDKLAPILRRLEEGSRRILRRVAAQAGASDEPRYEIFHDRLGKAILAWRAKRLKEQEREKSQRDEAEQKRVAEETRGRYRGAVNAAMAQLGRDGQAVWARIMFYLVSTDGRRLAQRVDELASLSREPFADIERVLIRLAELKIVRRAFAAPADSDSYEVVDDAIASSLIEWHSQYVLSQKAEERPATDFPTHDDFPAPGPDFPYRLVRDLLVKGQLVPFLGAGVGLSARPQDAASLDGDTPFLPSNRELKEILARACDFPPSEFEGSDISEVASFYVQRLGRQSLDALLARTLGRSDYTPSSTHRVLAEIARSAPLVILTTNYDTMMERALSEIGAMYSVLEDPLTGHGPLHDWEPRLESHTIIVRLCGPVAGVGYRITEEDQMQLVSALSEWPWPPVVARRLESGLLSLGHSARDWSQRALLREVKQRAKGRSWAVALNPSPLSVMTWQRYQVEVSNLDLNDWAASMRAAGTAPA